MLASQHGDSVTLFRDMRRLIRDDGQIFKVQPSPAKVNVLGNFQPIEGTIRAYPAIGAGLGCIRNAKVIACLK